MGLFLAAAAAVWIAAVRLTHWVALVRLCFYLIGLVERRDRTVAGLGIDSALVLLA